MTDEDAMFEVWFQLQRRKDWEKRYPGESFHDNWSMGYREAMRDGWMARASLHVVKHRGCGPDCTLPAGHLGDHVRPSLARSAGDKQP